MQTITVSCPHCNAKNKIPAEKADTPAKCGRCHQWLPVDGTDGGSQEDSLTLRCGQCRVKNRIPTAKLHSGAKCGRCGAALEHENLFSGRQLVVNEADFGQIVLRAPLPVLLYGWAPWCSVCRGTSPMVEELAKEMKGKVRVVKLNIDTNPGLASQYTILSVPAFIIFDAGQVKAYLPGAVPKHELMIKMAAYIS